MYVSTVVIMMSQERTPDQYLTTTGYTAYAYTDSTGYTANTIYCDEKTRQCKSYNKWVPATWSAVPEDFLIVPLYGNSSSGLVDQSG